MSSNGRRIALAAAVFAVAVVPLTYFAVVYGLRASLRTALVPPTTMIDHVARLDAMKPADAVVELSRRGVSVSDASLLRYVQDGNEDFVKMLLLAGVSPNATDSFAGETALHHAAGHPRRLGILQVLVRAGANLNAQDKGGQTALFTAAIVRNNAAIRALLEAGADPWVRKNTGETALAYADTDENRRCIRAAMERTRPR